MFSFDKSSFLTLLICETQLWHRFLQEAPLSPRIVVSVSPLCPHSILHTTKLQ